MGASMTASRIKVVLLGAREGGKAGFMAWYSGSGSPFGAGFSEGVKQTQREFNDYRSGIHDDLLYASALGMLCWKRPPWYKRWWWAVKRFCKSLRIGL